MARRLPGGGKAWFVRGRARHGYELTPSSAAGWLLTLLYVLAAIGFSLLLLGEEQGAARWTAWGVLMVAGTFAFFLTAFRMSVPAAPSGKEKE